MVYSKIIVRQRCIHIGSGTSVNELSLGYVNLNISCQKTRLGAIQYPKMYIAGCYPTSSALICFFTS